MRVDKAFSNKIKVLSFVATIFVVLIHSDATATGGMSAWNIWLHGFVTQQIAGLAVPFFFVVSGFWFARGYCSSAGGVRVFYIQESKNTSSAIFYICTFGVAVCSRISCVLELLALCAIV